MILLVFQLVEGVGRRDSTERGSSRRAIFSQTVCVGRGGLEQPPGEEAALLYGLTQSCSLTYSELLPVLAAQPPDRTKRESGCPHFLVSHFLDAGQFRK